jgi:hypothetical protein
MPHRCVWRHRICPSAQEHHPLVVALVDAWHAAVSVHTDVQGPSSLVLGYVEGLRNPHPLQVYGANSIYAFLQEVVEQFRRSEGVIIGNCIIMTVQTMCQPGHNSGAASVLEAPAVRVYLWFRGKPKVASNLNTNFV